VRNYPREYLWFVERVLREHPQREQELRDKEKTIAACCRAPSIPDSEVRGEGPGMSEEERILEVKERDCSYQRILKRVNAVNAALMTLRADEKELVKLLLWEGAWKSEVAELMDIDAKTVWNMKHRVLREVAPFVIGDWMQN
jgi:DNA-directed RNA polymerase specialized sigma24 family protein